MAKILLQIDRKIDVFKFQISCQIPNYQFL